MRSPGSHRTLARRALLGLVALSMGDGVPCSAEEPSVHWAFQPVVQPAVPVVEHPWPRTDIDRFVLLRLQQSGVEPAPEADPATLLRRLHLDLSGLPPTDEERASFLADPDEPAYAEVVDRLLASPHHAERWSQHWLDLARYADSDGYEKDEVRPWAWRWRDWVLDSFHRDQPYDEFLCDQIAGDLWAAEQDADDPTARRRRIATGFHRNTLTNREGGVDAEQYRVEQVVDRVDTLGTAVMGLTLACARCHDHKYDPISQREFFQLDAFFDSADEKDLVAPLPGDEKARAPTLAERETPRRTRVHHRGDFLRPRDPVTRSTPDCLGAGVEAATPDRRDLARWLVAPSHPLTARVFVNRVWQHLFGTGLVASPGDFGRRGLAPSHPELLDWLAAEVVAKGWSRKELIRSIVLSSTYRQSSRRRPALEQRDPDNRLLARQNRWPIEAESVRDLALAASGLLSRRVGGPSVRPPMPPGVTDIGYAGGVKWPESPGEDRHRRGLYVFRQRTVPYPMLATFDAPDTLTACARRGRSNTPLQTLTLRNDPVFVECAQALGRRLARVVGADASRIEAAVGALLSRPVRPEEQVLLLRQLRQDRAHYEARPDAARAAAGEAAATPAADAAQAAACTLLVRTLMTLDEFITRE